MLYRVKSRPGYMPGESNVMAVYLRIPLFIAFLGFFCLTEIIAQEIEQDSLPPQRRQVETIEPKVEKGKREFKNHSPQKAAMLSATFPGLGQIYNRRYWKVPIIYAGYGGIAYAFNFNNNNYQKFRRAYYARVDNNPNTAPDEEFSFYSTDQLKRGMDGYRYYLEVTYITAAALYVLSILDATVDAHLLDFDVSEDLTLNVRPSVLSVNPFGTGNFLSTPGIKLTFRF